MIVGVAITDMTNYNLFSASLELGGVLRSSVDFSTGEFFHSHMPAAEARAIGGQPAGLPALEEDSPPDCPHLSTAHISPRIKVPAVEWYPGASIFRVTKGGEVKQVGGGVRGQIHGFSDAARRRLMVLMGKIDKSAGLPAFVTLTYPGEYPDSPGVWKSHLDTFSKRFRRAFPGAGFIWKLEPQKRGAPHYHLLAWGCSLDKLREFVPLAWYQIAGSGDVNHLLWHVGQLGNAHCVQAVRTWQGVMSYAAKYLGKSFQVSGWDYVGRFWGVVNRSGIPFVDPKTEEVTYAKACEMLRYQRRFMRSSSRRLKKKITPKGASMTIFCDASQWAARLLGGVGSLSGGNPSSIEGRSYGGGSSITTPG